MVSVTGGGFRRLGKSVGAVIAAGWAAGLAGAGVIVSTLESRRGRNSQHAERTDIHLGRWSYLRKGKRTAAQRKRAARKKRNRARRK